MNPLKMGWLGKSIYSLIFVVPCWIAIGFFDRNYGVSGGLFLVWFSFGMTIGTAVILNGLGLLSLKDILQPTWPKIGVFLVGLIIGPITNILLFEAAAKAPNKGLPSTIQSASSILIPFVNISLFWLFPQLFEKTIFDQYQIVGTVFVLIGLLLIALSIK